MRCQAKVLTEKALEIRSSDDPDPRCQRNAKTWVAGFWRRVPLCNQHARIWRKHNQIVRDILNCG